MSGYNWFKATVNYLKNNFTIHHLISVTPCTPSAFNSLPDIDFIMIENRGIPAEFRAFGKPVVCAGPSASKPVDEPEFMRTAFIRGFHPSTNLRAECSSITSGYNYALVLQAFIESVKTWYDEPGNEITRDTVPPTYNCNYPFSSPPRID
jgi:hypothetical protein